MQVNTDEKGHNVRLYMFKSEKGNKLHAFAGDPAGSQLPKQHGPWTGTGIVSPDNAPPHNMSRSDIEQAIETEGFQLWRLAKKKSDADT
jgi:hypothetical protein